MSIDQVKEKILKIKSFLSPEELEQDIIEVDKIELINYLEKIGSQEIEYETGNVPHPGIFTELGGVTNLWYKNDDDIWIIKNWEIKRFFKQS